MGIARGAARCQNDVVGHSAIEQPTESLPTVLAVDDDPNVLKLMQVVLARSGFEVVGAESGREALEEFRRRRGAVDLLVSDVVMPVMDGPALAEEIAKTNPELPVLFVSGFVRNPEQLQRVAHSARLSILSKPFSPALLVKRVRELLAI